MIAGKLLARGIDFVSLLVLGDLLDTVDFGLVAMAMVLIQIVEAVLELPVIQALLRADRVSDKMLDTAFTLGLMRASIIALLVFGLSQPLARFYDDVRLVNLVQVLALGPMFRGLISPRMVFFQRKMNFRTEATIEVIAKLLSLAAGYSVARTTHSYWALAAVTCTTPLALAVLSYAVAPYRPRLSLGEWPQFAGIVGWTSLSQLLRTTNWQMDRLLLGRFVGPAPLGTYFMASNLAAVPLQAIVMPTAGPIMAALSRLKSDAEMRKAYLMASSSIFVVAAPPMMVLALLAEPLIRIVLDEKWLPAAELLCWLVLAILPTLPTEPITGLAILKGQTRFGAARSAVLLAVRAPTLFLGIYYYGIFGALVANGITSVMNLFVTALLARRLIALNVTAQMAALVRPVLALAVPSVLMLVCVDLLNALTSRWYLALMTLAVGAVALMFNYGALIGLWFMAGKPEGAESYLYKTSARAIVQIRYRLTFGRRGHP